MAADTDSKPIVSVQHVSKDFVLPHQKVTSVKGLFLSAFRTRQTTERQHALRDVSFDVHHGEFFGIVGRNGSGKSTLLKILANIYQPTKGSVSVRGKLVPFIELGVGFNPELTGRENVFLNGAMMGFSEAETAAMYDEIVAFAELENFMDQKLKNYSSGMQVRLAFSVAIKAQAEILLVDEVLAVGDADFQRKCFSYFKQLKRDKKTVIFVTHDMNAVREFCDRALLVDDGKVQYIGTPKEAARDYALLFIKDASGIGTEASKQRWGNGGVKFTDVKAKLVGDKLRINASARVGQRTVDGLLYGVHIVGEDGTDVTATNNRLIGVSDLKDLSSGTVIEFSWEILNVFNDGTYTITLTLVDDEQTPLDWFHNAASFVVKRPDRSTTAVIPPISVKATVDRGS